MNYTEFRFTISPKIPNSEMLMAYLSEASFDSFVESEEGFWAYSSKANAEKVVGDILNSLPFQNAEVQYETQQVEDKNWNAEWEKDFKPIIVDDLVYIKADFHPEKEYPYLIRIQPKMAFGTGHHETTYLMIQMMNEMDFEGKKVLDMGTGTAILAIFASMKGATQIDAIDIDKWAYENALENVVRNDAKIQVEWGDVSLLNGRSYDCVLANINKNILIEDIPRYSKVLTKGGELLLSGILDSDEDDIKAICNENGLVFVRKKQKNEWISVLYRKK